jgi:hypothetical protein
LDVKLQEKAKAEANANVDNIKSLIKDNAERIATVGENNKIRLKAVGNMTTANFTGEEPRDYNFDIVRFPSQMLNVADLTGNININGGTYTYTVNLTGGCGTISKTGTIIVSPTNTILFSSLVGTDNQTVCINIPITHITYTTTGATVYTTSAQVLLTDRIYTLAVRGFTGGAGTQAIGAWVYPNLP